MSKKLEYAILIIFSLILMGIFLYQMQAKDVGFTDFTHDKVIVKPLYNSCEIDSDCVLDEAVVLCPAEVRCEENKCVTYCIYDDVESADMFQVSECLEDIDPLSVRDGEYTLNWSQEEELTIEFNIVLACNIQGLSGYYELAAKNQLSLNYEYKVPLETEPCLCVRKLSYKVPHLSQLLDYEIIINKIEK